MHIPFPIIDEKAKQNVISAISYHFNQVGPAKSLENVKKIIYEELEFLCRQNGYTYDMDLVVCRTLLDILCDVDNIVLAEWKHYCTGL